MLTRIITSIVATLIILPVLWFSDTFIFPTAIAIAAFICVYEMSHCVGLHKNIAITLPLYAATVAFPFLTRYLENGKTVMIAFICAALYMIYLFALTIWSHGKLAYKDVCAFCLIVFYIIIALDMLVYIRDFGENGHFLYFLAFIGAWITDIFAYFTGVFFGKHKLIEDVSPKKTIEGSIGGTVFCSIGFVVLGLIAEAFGAEANLVFLAVGGVIIAVISQIGDLIMSVIKRHYGIKDYGKMFPGHGGMLDRVDSLLAVSLALGAMCMFSYVTGIPLM